MPRAFAPQLSLSQSAQLFMDERNQLLECRLVALTPGLKEAGSVRRRVRRGAHPAIEQKCDGVGPIRGQAPVRFPDEYGMTLHVPPVPNSWFNMGRMPCAPLAVTWAGRK